MLCKGLTGFGFGILGTALLVNFVPAGDAVTLMILPMLAVNVPLILDADRSVLRTCLKNYRFFVASGLLGALTGVLLVGFLPTRLLAVSAGLLAVFYVYSKQTVFYRPETGFSRLLSKNPLIQSFAGIVSGLAFGGSNVGLLYVTYLKEIGVYQRTFAGLLSIIILGGTLLRASVSAATGLYTPGLLSISVVAMFFAVVFSEAGSRLSQKLPEKICRNLALILILVAGLRIIWVNATLSL